MPFGVKIWSLLFKGKTTQKVMRIIFYLILIRTAMSIIINTIYYHVSIGMVNSLRSFYESKVGSRNIC